MLTRLNARFSRGDTLIEVLFAVTVFSFVVVGALAIMNQGTAAAQRSLDITMVRQEIDAQAETLRFLHDSYVSVYRSGLTFNTTDATSTPAEEWYRIATSGVGSGSVSALTATTNCPTPPSGSFILDTRNTRFVNGASRLQPATTFAQLEYPASGGNLVASRGIWIEAIRSPQNTTDPNQQNVRYIDFHIRSCWKGAGLDVPMTVGTIVRLYEPRG